MHDDCSRWRIALKESDDDDKSWTTRGEPDWGCWEPIPHSRSSEEHAGIVVHMSMQL